MKIKDIGLGLRTKSNAKGILSNNGYTNVVHINKTNDIGEVFTKLINVSWAKFFTFILLGYIIINIFFGLIYTFIGIEQLTEKSDTFFEDFLQGFFFSAQTITTVGYGGISPNGILASIVSTFEALIGLLSFSFVTGLLYGRFSKPQASISFSKHFIKRPFKKGNAIMFRLKNNRSNMLLEPNLEVNSSFTRTVNGESKREFFNLGLERKSIMYLPTAWTVVHEIDEHSPFYNLNYQEIFDLKVEIYILLKYYDEGFNQTIYKTHTYHYEDLIDNKQFKKTLVFDDNGHITLDHKTFDELIDVER